MRPSGDWFHRLRALRQRHGEDPCIDRRGRHRQYQTLRRRRRRTRGLAPRRFTYPGGSALPRSMAEASALETTVRARSHDCDTCARIAARRPLSLCYRRSGLCRLDARTLDTLAGFLLDRGRRRRLAQAMGWISWHPVRGEGKARGANALLSRISPRCVNPSRADPQIPEDRENSTELQHIRCAVQTLYANERRS